MNNLLLILGIIALSNGNISLFDNKSKPKVKSSKEDENPSNSLTKLKPKKSKTQKTKKVRKVNNNKSRESSESMFNFNMSDINNSLKLMDLSDEDLERGMEIITRTKKYMSRDERKVLIQIESLLDLVRGIKKLSSIDTIGDEEETNFFRSMDEDDKKNMMIKEILEVFPEKRKDSIEKAIDMKKKIDLFAELFLPDDFGEGGFSLSSLANINNLGSVNNLKLLGSLLRGYDKDTSDDNEEYEEYEDEEDEEYEFEDDDYEDDGDEEDE